MATSPAGLDWIHTYSRVMPWARGERVCSSRRSPCQQESISSRSCVEVPGDVVVSHAVGSRAVGRHGNCPLSDPVHGILHGGVEVPRTDERVYPRVWRAAHRVVLILGG
jgi:hypothetical protein